MCLCLVSSTPVGHLDPQEESPEVFSGVQTINGPWTGVPWTHKEHPGCIEGQHEKRSFRAVL